MTQPASLSAPLRKVLTNQQQFRREWADLSLAVSDGGNVEARRVAPRRLPPNDLGYAASWLRRGPCLPVDPGLSSERPGRCVSLSSVALASQPDTGRHDRATTCREQLTDSSPAC